MLTNKIPHSKFQTKERVLKISESFIATRNINNNNFKL